MQLSLVSVFLCTYLVKSFGTTLAGIGQLDFVNGPNVSTPIRGSSSVVMLCIQGKHFCTCGDGEKVNNGGGGKVKVIIECAIV